ncbi:hypothetical protein D3C81_1878770 [compost metagenome]
MLEVLVALLERCLKRTAAVDIRDKTQFADTECTLYTTGHIAFERGHAHRATKLVITLHKKSQYLAFSE